MTERSYFILESVFWKLHKESPFSPTEFAVFAGLKFAWNGMRRPQSFEITISQFANTLDIGRKYVGAALKNIANRGLIEMTRGKYSYSISFNIPSNKENDSETKEVQAKDTVGESQKCNNYTSDTEFPDESKRHISEDSDESKRHSRCVKMTHKMCQNDSSTPYYNKRLLNSLSKRKISESESDFSIKGKEEIHKVAEEWYIENADFLFDTSGNLSKSEFASLVRETVTDIKIKNKPYKSKDELTSHLTNLYRRKLEDFFKRHKYD